MTIKSNEHYTAEQLTTTRRIAWENGVPYSTLRDWIIKGKIPVWVWTIEKLEHQRLLDIEEITAFRSLIKTIKEYS